MKIGVFQHALCIITLNYWDSLINVYYLFVTEDIIMPSPRKRRAKKLAKARANRPAAPEPTLAPAPKAKPVAAPKAKPVAATEAKPKKPKQKLFNKKDK